jgi:hypothetical protein
VRILPVAASFRKRECIATPSAAASILAAKGDEQSDIVTEDDQGRELLHGVATKPAVLWNMFDADA